MAQGIVNDQPAIFRFLKKDEILAFLANLSSSLQKLTLQSKLEGPSVIVLERPVRFQPASCSVVLKVQM